MPDAPRTAFQEAAELREHTTLERLLRLQLRPPAIPPTVSAQTAADPHTFEPTTEGSGIFGRWINDEAGLPAYQYELDQYSDERARYYNTENLNRRDHWHQVGNFRVTGLASNDGTVQVYMGDRGGVFLNRFEAHGAPGVTLLSLLARLAIWIANFLSRIAVRKPPPPSPLDAQAQALAAVEETAIEGQLNPRSSPSLEVLDMIAQTGSPDAFGAQTVSVTPSQLQKQAATYKRDWVSTRHNYAGGFSFIHDGRATWATAYRYRPNGAVTRRVFGMGYFETETVYRNVRVTRRVYAPYGDVPALLVDTTIENLSDNPADLQHYEYWDVNVHQLKLEWLRSGAFAAASDEIRRALNKNFACSIKWKADQNALVCQQTLREPPPAQAVPPDDPSEIDWSPPCIFLADLSGTPDAHYIHRKAFFGQGGAKQPDAIVNQRAGDEIQAQAGEDDAMCFCMVLRRDLSLGPHERRHLRYAYGAVRPEEGLGFLDAYRDSEQAAQNSPFEQMRAAWKQNITYFHTGLDPVLHREMAWHSYYLLSATVKSSFHKVHVVPQGSAYLYLHGADGAPRDQGLFAVPMTYLNPSLAKDLLRLIMRITDGQTGQITYSFAGHGFISNALNVHNKPSDLDLFFLLGMTEYLAATGDFDFLKEEVPYYPPNRPHNAPGDTVLDHIRFAVKHLFEGVGIGRNDLVKVGSGDWSDSIVLETALKDGPGPFGVTYQNSKDNGESVPNTQMALYVLPLLSAILAERAPDVGQVIGQHIDRLRSGASRQWNERGWYNRAVLRGFDNRDIKLEHLDLEAQPWALISGLAQAEQRDKAVIQNVTTYLDDPSMIGASLLPGGMVWPAVSQLLTWGYVRAGRGALAWRSLNRNTYAAHKAEYPAIWFSTWSGPDGIQGVGAKPPAIPGGSWESPMTPMTDFPVMNANPDAMALLGLLRVCGIEPAPGGDGLTIRPVVPREQFTLETYLLRLHVEPGRISGVYRGVTDGERKLYVHLPADVTHPTILVGGQPSPPTHSADGWVIPLVFRADDSVAFEVRWT